MTIDKDELLVGQVLQQHGISRRGFIKYCTAAASALALPSWMGPAMAEQLRNSRRPSVVYLSFQECTGCIESFTRSFAPTIEQLIFNVISLDYTETLMAAAGDQAESALDTAMRENFGKYILIVDGSIPTGAAGGYCTIGGKSAVDTLREASVGAAAIVCVGTCAAFGGIPFANPNPTQAWPVSGIVSGKPIINIPGCPPIGEVIAGTLLQFVTTGKVPDLDQYLRPTAFYGNTIHDRCYRRPFYDAGKFAKSFDDEGARNGWCLLELGCKGPITYNACATVKWNGGTSFPIESGHGCLGCSEPNFWDKESFYSPLSSVTHGKAGESSPRTVLEVGGASLAIGSALGIAAAAVSRIRQRHAEEPPTPTEASATKDEGKSP
jgi:hydrogenase small subunit